MPSEKLAGCPFCGGSAKLKEGHKDHWRAECTACPNVQTVTYARDGAKEKAIAAWNHRTPDRLSELEELVREAGEVVGPFAGDHLPSTHRRTIEIVTDRHGDRVAMNEMDRARDAARTFRDKLNTFLAKETTDAE